MSDEKRIPKPRGVLPGTDFLKLNGGHMSNSTTHSPSPVFVLTMDEFDPCEGRGEGPPFFWGSREEVEAELRRLLAEAAAVEDTQDAWDVIPRVRCLEADGKVSKIIPHEKFLWG